MRPVRDDLPLDGRYHRSPRRYGSVPRSLARKRRSCRLRYFPTTQATARHTLPLRGQRSRFASHGARLSSRAPNCPSPLPDPSRANRQSQNEKGGPMGRLLVSDRSKPIRTCSSGRP